MKLKLQVYNSRHVHCIKNEAGRLHNPFGPAEIDSRTYVNLNSYYDKFYRIEGKDLGVGVQRCPDSELKSFLSIWSVNENVL